MDAKVNLFGKTLGEMESIVSEMGFPRYTAGQLCQWLYHKGAADFGTMTNVSKKARKALDQKFTIDLSPPADIQVSQDGTRKYLFATSHNKFIESVNIPDRTRSTLCISVQIGCKLGCVFCLTGKQGFHGNLSPGEILNQYVSLPNADMVTNLVFMGMGEPMDNIDSVLKVLEILTSGYGFGMSPSRITVSTLGLLPGLKRFMEECKSHLAVSLHSPFAEERQMLMPVERKYPIREIIQYLRSLPVARQRRISFEYILFRDLNDSGRHVNEMARLLNGLRCRVNLIRFHPIPGATLQSPEETRILWFKDRLNEKGILTTIRASRGEDILAACGMLSTAKSQTPH